MANTLSSDAEPDAKQRPHPKGRGGGRGRGGTGGGGGGGKGPGPMDVPLLEKLVSLMSDHGLTSMELADGDQRISLSRGGTPTTTTTTTAAPSTAPVTQASPAPAPTSAPTATSATAEASAPAAASTSGLKEITSPMVGTFYASPNPDAKPFVSVGSSVSKETDVCVIEAMKVFNTIQAEASGTIEKLLVENGQAVEYGQALFLIKPS